MAIRIGLLKDPKYKLHAEWLESLKKYSDKISIVEIDFTSSRWIEQVESTNCDIYILRSPGFSESYKRMIDERTYILRNILNKPIYPSLTELLIYENKRVCAYWLQANNIPHPKTWIFYDYDEAKSFTNQFNYPIVAKLSLGAGGSGVNILHSKSEYESYLIRAFTGKGLTRTWGPNIRKGSLIKRLLTRLKAPVDTYRYFRDKRAVRNGEPQKNFVILQEYIKCNHEWRCVVIGDSYFGHKKLRTLGEKISGTSAVSWDIPNKKLLDFVKEICDKGSFTSMAIDIFEDLNGNYFVNELQCYFGSKNPHQMIWNGRPGRFIKKENDWVFQEGVFNSNNSFDLRTEYLLSNYFNEGK